MFSLRQSASVDSVVTKTEQIPLQKSRNDCVRYKQYTGLRSDMQNGKPVARKRDDRKKPYVGPKLTVVRPDRAQAKKLVRALLTRV
jgi:hypothetical protein